MRTPTIFPPEVLQLIRESFPTAASRGRRRQPATLVRIRLDGEFVTVRNGKQAWSSVGAAKAAIRNHLNYIRIRDDQDRWYDQGLNRDEITDVMRELERTGRLEYVPADNTNVRRVWIAFYWPPSQTILTPEVDRVFSSAEEATEYMIKTNSAAGRNIVESVKPFDVL